jgi:hypothetical protein
MYEGLKEGERMELEVAFWITSVGTTAVTQALNHMKPLLIRNLESVSLTCNLCCRKSRSASLQALSSCSDFLIIFFNIYGGTQLEILKIYLRKHSSSLIRQHTLILME